MLRRFFILIALMLFGPLFLELYLYHSAIALEHDPVAIFPRVAVAAAFALGFLVLALDNKVTTGLFAIACGVTILAGIIGTAIHLAIHAPGLGALATDPSVWLGGPPVLVPLSLAVAGCLGLIPLSSPHARVAAPAASRLLEASAALFGAAAIVAGGDIRGGFVALMAIFAGLGLGIIAYLIELIVLFYPISRHQGADFRQPSTAHKSS